MKALSDRADTICDESQPGCNAVDEMTEEYDAQWKALNKVRNILKTRIEGLGVVSQFHEAKEPIVCVA